MKVRASNLHSVFRLDDEVHSTFPFSFCYSTADGISGILLMKIWLIRKTINTWFAKEKF
jgi:hypothetical protein